MSEESTTGCKRCVPGFERTGQRLHHGHIAVRFGDTGRYRIQVDDNDVTDLCVEAMDSTHTSGLLSWALVLHADANGRKHQCCQCGGGEPCMEELHGIVQIAG